MGATSGRPFTTLDTVDTDTPVADAILARVARSVLVDTMSFRRGTPYSLLCNLHRGQQASIVTDDPGCSGYP